MSDDDSSFVQLGFCVPIESEEHFYDVGHRNTNYNRWDGGQMGGYPTWLNPYSVPSQPIQCKSCPMKMNFLCQLYAPIDDTGNDDSDNKAYHRTIYIFVCPNMTSAGHTPTSSVRVLRCQLYKDNPYWPAISNNNNSNNDNDANGKNTSLNKETQQQQKRPLCIICAFPSQGRCPLQKVHFCCKEHQILYKKYVYNNKKLATNTSDNNSNEVVITPTTMTLQQQQTMISLLPNNILYPLYEIVVEDENDDNDDNDDKDILNQNRQQQSDQITKIETMFPSNKNDNNDGEYDSDEDLDQDDLNEMVLGQTKGTSKKQDRIYEQFMDRIQSTNGGQNKNQILRYNRWPEEDDTNSKNKNGPLWIQTNIRPSKSSTSCIDATTAATTSSDIPKCQYCGSQRKFEFQVMPQLLHYLNKKTNKENNRMTTSKDGSPITTTTTDSAINTKNSNSSSTSVISQQVIDAIEQTNTLLENVPAELISPDLVDTKERAIQSIQRTLFNDANNSRLDWGIIAVYTCTNSCSYSIETATRKNKKATSTESNNDHTTLKNKNGFGNDDDEEEDFGEYLEEFAWVQPSIDSIV